MPEEQYELMIESLNKSIELAILKFANEHGLKVSCESLRQGSVFYHNKRERLIELLSLGMDIWPESCDDDPDGGKGMVIKNTTIPFAGAAMRRSA